MIYFGPNFFLELVNGGFDVRVMCVIAQSPKPMFLLDEVWDGSTDRRFGVVVAVHFDVDVSTAFMSLSHKVTTRSSSLSCVVMFVSVLVRLSFSVLCSESSFFLSNW